MDNTKEMSKIAFNQQALTYDKDIKGQHARTLYPYILNMQKGKNTTKINIWNMHSVKIRWCLPDGRFNAFFGRFVSNRPFFCFSPVHWKQQVELNNHKTM